MEIIHQFKTVRNKYFPKMHSISNLFKFNDLEKKKPEFDKMSIEELKSHLRRLESLSKNKELANMLPDKGEKVNNQLKLLQVNIQLANAV